MDIRNVSEVNDELIKMIERGVRDVKLIYSDGTSVKKRLRKDIYGTPMLMIRKSRRRGEFLSSFCYNTRLIDIKAIEIDPDAEKRKWEVQIDKIIAYLSISGLWPNMLESFNIVRHLGLKKLEKAIKIYQSYPLDMDYREQAKWRREKIEAISPLFFRVENGQNTFNCEILNHSRYLKIIKMRFSKNKDTNQEKLLQVASLIKRGVQGSVEGKLPQEVWFEHHQNSSTAHYSEFIQRNGRSTNYRVLNETHALYWEKG